MLIKVEFIFLNLYIDRASHLYYYLVWTKKAFFSIMNSNKIDDLFLVKKRKSQNVEEKQKQN